MNVPVTAKDAEQSLSTQLLENDRKEQAKGGLIGLFARHPTAGNLLMLVMIIAGLIAISKINRQFFPTFTIDSIVVSTVWSGATADDIESNILKVIEPEVRFLDNVDKVISIALEGYGVVQIEFREGSDMQQALSDIDAAIARISTLPDDAEEPTINRPIFYDTISRLVISGDVSEDVLKNRARQIREDLLARGVDKVEYGGLRADVLSVDLPTSRLRQLGIELVDVSDAIESAANDVPAGDLTGDSQSQPRAIGNVESRQQIENVAVRMLPNGQRLTIGDIASVFESYDDGDTIFERRGKPAISLHVQRSATSDTLTIADIVSDYLEEVEQTLPPNMVLERFDAASNLVEERISLLLRNGLGGLILVIGVLFLFLNTRVAFWVAMGIPISLLAMLGVLWMMGMTINMISLFAMILALGIIVDDAIVVGEHSADLASQGLPAQKAAEFGARRMAAPVISASATTICAFLPLMVIGDIIGQIIGEIPWVVIAVLVASLVECFFVLPAHLRHALAHKGEEARWRVAFNRGFDRVKNGFFRSLVSLAVTWRYTTLAIAIACLILSFGFAAAGKVGFVFFSGPESEKIFANLQMSPGTPRDTTQAAIRQIDEALYATEVRIQEEFGLEKTPGNIVKMSLAQLGVPLKQDEGQAGGTGDNVGAINVELVSADERPLLTSAFIEFWREEIPAIAGVEELTLTPVAGGPPGRELDIRLKGSAGIADLKDAANEVKDLLQALPGVSQIADDLPYGKQEIAIELNARGESLGLTIEAVGRQLRNAYQGIVAHKFTRNDEEVEIQVRLEESERDLAGLDQFQIRTPSGRDVYLSEVASLEAIRGFAQILREDGTRQVGITAELDEATIRQEQVIETLTTGGDLDRITRAYGLEYEFAGKAQEQSQTLGDIRLGAIAGLCLIYIVLAWVFGSFTRPFSVMFVIPFGIIGAIVGHMVLGYDLSILSIIALLGLSGILVNDSIILVAAIDERIKAGRDVFDSVVDGTVSRFRAVLLTSFTTIVGLTPLMFETSLQAQFLIPMAVTITFGLMVTTFLVLLLVPSLIGIQADIGRLTLWTKRRVFRMKDPRDDHTGIDATSPATQQARMSAGQTS